MLKKPSTHELNARLHGETYKVQPILVDETKKNTLRKLVIVLLLAFTFMGIEIAGGIISHSIAILSDAAHMLSDLLGFVISILSVYISGLPANKKHSYGYHRAGVIGALASVLVIWVLTGFLIYFAIRRVINLSEVEVEGPVMFGVACFGLLTNLIMIKVLHGGDGHDHGHGHGHSHENEHGHSHSHGDSHNKKRVNDTHNHKEKDLKKNKDDKKEPLLGHEGENKPDLAIVVDEGHNHNHDHDHNHSHDHDQDHNNHSHSHKPQQGQPESEVKGKSKEHTDMNIRATIIHIFGDILQSIGVIIASGLIWINPEFKIADPIVTFIFAVIVLYTTLRIIKDCIFVLMEGTPADFDLDEFEMSIKSVEGVLEIHDLHVWALGVGKPAMSAHILTNQNSGAILKRVTRICRKYEIFHSTVQIETIQDKAHVDYFECKHNIH